MNNRTYLIGFALLLSTASLPAGEADIENVRLTALDNNRYRVDVTVQHADTGWDHYADRWDILDMQDNVLGSRILAHPHVNEQPFTRSLTLTIPENVQQIKIRAHDSQHKLGGKEFLAEVPQR